MKIGIVNDMPLAVEALQRALAFDPELRVVWVASDGAQAVDACMAQRPDVILMDLLMPVMDGVEATRRIMAQTPCAIIVVTSDMDRHTSRVFDAMGHGAVDVIDTPRLGAPNPRAAAAALLRKIRNVGWLIGAYDRGRPAQAATAAHPLAAGAAPRLIGIGASAGGPPSLATLLGGLPGDFPAAIVLVQHVDASFAAGMATWLDEQIELPVRLAANGERPQPGTVLLAGTDDHLVLHNDGTLRYTREPAEGLYRPSIDVFFDSVARHCRAPAIGVVLTGMGRDGALGLRAMRERGMLTIAQDRASSAVYGMPKAAAELNAAGEILPLDRIAARLIAALGMGASVQRT
ncbi:MULTISPECIES: chemotaxis response regulator protein-glutamate methylesterase [unclassified Achromobacter]|uniref:chemotaxis response regulator protein-glutamate methylesterase n=1 Tax=unclassified Achromobacter TaxID=2626865 RepID=UPI000B517E21|nr:MULTISPECIES: chemotaxis response regulator protein-glutamate methylesterase [unclassified Achromobacter]OWT70322.1 chemotaxis response regulator protein-glutamate methylesterase [Achromobacter sp. HZ34]OWT71862.1 chemotaxis response regulator protein-glutamate methylesterase [Achromobacter sp. HZ28]